MSARAPAEVLHAVQQLAAGDAGCRESYVVAFHKVIGGQNLFQVDALGLHARPLLLIARPDFALDLATDAFQGCCGQHGFRCATSTQQHIDAGVVFHRGHDSRENIAIGNQANARAGLADLLDHCGMARAIQDHNGDIVNARITRFGDIVQVVRNGRVDIDQASGSGTNGDFFHVKDTWRRGIH